MLAVLPGSIVELAADAVLGLLPAVVAVTWIAVNLYMYVPYVLAEGEGDSPYCHVSQADVTEGDGLPSFDVLLPAYEEWEVIDQAISSVRSADYPQDEIDIHVLTEPEDDATREALAELRDEYRFRVVTVPEAYPGEPNKPRALNYGFERSDGDIVGIVDAEDIVHPDTFRRAAHAIGEEGCDYAQGWLDMVNEDDGWLNTLFRAEYGHWFQSVLPRHFHCGYPIPLGGTTNFFDRDVLVEISQRRLEEYGSPWPPGERRLHVDGPQSGGADAGVEPNGGVASEAVSDLDGRVPWDPRNVTEDFEIGLFLWKEGYELGLVEVVTREESPTDVDSWIRQRTRWQKGKLQTFVQYLRRPPSDVRARFHLFMESWLPHLGPINLAAVFTLLLLANVLGWEPSTPVLALLVASGSFVPLIAALHASAYWRCSDATRWKQSLRAAIVFLTLPLYWFLQWVADVRAIKQVYLGEDHWEKTPHAGRNAPDAVYVGLPKRAKETVSRLRWLIPVIVLGGLVRLYRIDVHSYWLDELYSVSVRGDLPVSYLVLRTTDPHPPLYYVLLHFWMELFGTSALATRTLSALFGIGTVVAVYGLGAALFDRRAGLVSALLLSVSVLHVHHSQNARMYTLFVLLAVVSLYYFRKLTVEASYGALIWYVVTTALMMLTHVFAGFVVLAQNLQVGLRRVLSTDRDGAPPLGLWVTAQVFVGLTVLPWVLLIGRYVWNIATGTVEGAIGWLSTPAVSLLGATMLRYFGNPHTYPIIATTETTRRVATAELAVVALATLVAAAAALRNRTRGGGRGTTRGGYALLALVILTSWILPFLVSWWVVPIYTVRNTIVASVAAYLLVGALLARLPDGRLQVLVVAMLLVGSLYTAGIYHETGTQEPWAEAVERVEANAGDDALVLVHPRYVNFSYRYYADRDDLPMMGVPASGTLQVEADGRGPKIGPYRISEVWVLHRGTDESMRRLLRVLERSPYRLRLHTTMGELEVASFVLETDTERSTARRGERQDRGVRSPESTPSGVAAPEQPSAKDGSMVSGHEIGFLEDSGPTGPHGPTRPET